MTLLDALDALFAADARARVVCRDRRETDPLNLQPLTTRPEEHAVRAAEALVVRLAL